MVWPVLIVTIIWCHRAASSNNVKAGAASKNSHSGSAHFYHSFDGNVFSTSRRTGLTCRLCVLVDKEFMGVYGKGERDTVLKRLEKLVDAVDWNWRAVDWDGDKFPENIGFKIAKFQVGWNPQLGLGYNSSRTAMTLLSEFGQLDFSDCCLGIGFTMRPFLEKKVGIAFTVSINRLGGICDYRKPHGRLKSTNIILITGYGLEGYPLTSTDLELVLLHELGHAFGAHDHDNDDLDLNSTQIRECSGYGDGDVKNPNHSDDFFLNVEPHAGRYVMWADNKQGRHSLRWNNLQFSSCSKRQISQMLMSKRGVCFVQDSAPFCGNNILERGEECDCGTEVNCALMACCSSRSSKTPCKRLKGKSKLCPANKHAYPLSIALDRKVTSMPSEKSSGVGSARSSYLFPIFVVKYLLF